jgi:hypothetical protein
MILSIDPGDTTGIAVVSVNRCVERLEVTPVELEYQLNRINYQHLLNTMLVERFPHNAGEKYIMLDQYLEAWAVHRSLHPVRILPAQWKPWAKRQKGYHQGHSQDALWMALYWQFKHGLYWEGAWDE